MTRIEEEYLAFHIKVFRSKNFYMKLSLATDGVCYSVSRLNEVQIFCYNFILLSALGVQNLFCFRLLSLYIACEQYRCHE